MTKNTETSDESKPNKDGNKQIKVNVWDKFLKFWDKRNQIIYSVFYTIISITIFLGIWQLLSFYEVLVEPQIFSPSIIFTRIWFNLKTGSFYTNILASLLRLTISFSIAVVIGTLIGLAMGWSEKVYDFLDPLITFFMPIPGIAWAPLLVVWMGLESLITKWGLVEFNSWWGKFTQGNPVLIVIGIIAAVFPIIQNVSIATQATDKQLIWAAKTMGADSKTIFRKVLIPNSLPYLFTGLKLGLARCWRTIIATELLAVAANGLGFFIFENKDFKTPDVVKDIYAGIFVLAIIYYIIELGIKLIEKQTIEKWGMIRKAGGSLD